MEFNINNKNLLDSSLVPEGVQQLASFTVIASSLS